MGLEGVELVMEVEKRFSIQIEDGEATEIRTVGDLHHLVLMKVGRYPKGKCLSASVFRQLRQAMQEYGLNRSSIRLKKKLSEMVPLWRRRAFFEYLTRSTGLLMPPLRCPSEVTLTSILLVPVGAAVMSLELMPQRLFGGCFLLLIPLGIFAYIVTRPLAVQPQGCHTIAELTHTVLAHNYAKLSQKYQATNDREIWRMVCQIVADQLGVREKDLNPETRFIEDLNI